MQCIRIGHAPVATRFIGRGQKLPTRFQMDDQVTSPQDVIPVVAVAGGEAEGLVKIACARDIVRGKDRFCAVAGHGGLQPVLWRNEITRSRSNAVILLRAEGSHTVISDPVARNYCGRWDSVDCPGWQVTDPTA